ncbi:MAG: hypothetical protein LBL62_10400 [Planctomycetaceae bacterium]|nr:hypothetical protein [Planctomycetaceae bacterium]
MCITGGVAIAQPPDIRRTHHLKPRRGEIIKCEVNFPRPTVTHLAPAGLWELGSLYPAVTLRFTAGYAHLAPSGAIQ